MTNPFDVCWHGVAPWKRRSHARYASASHEDINGHFLFLGFDMKEEEYRKIRMPSTWNPIGIKMQELVGGIILVAPEEKY